MPTEVICDGETIAWELGYTKKGYYDPHFPFVRIDGLKIIYKRPFCYVFAETFSTKEAANAFFLMVAKDIAKQQIPYRKPKSDRDCDRYMVEIGILLLEIPPLVEYEPGKFGEKEWIDRQCILIRKGRR